MKILAIAEKGREFIYAPKTAHKVNAAKAEKVAAILNECGYMLTDAARYTWHVYDVDRYDNAYVYAQYQKFTYGKTGLKRVFCR